MAKFGEKTGFFSPRSGDRDRQSFTCDRERPVGVLRQSQRDIGLAQAAPGCTLGREKVKMFS